MYHVGRYDAGKGKVIQGNLRWNKVGLYIFIRIYIALKWFG